VRPSPGSGTVLLLGEETAKIGRSSDETGVLFFHYCRYFYRGVDVSANGCDEKFAPHRFFGKADCFINSFPSYEEDLSAFQCGLVAQRPLCIPHSMSPILEYSAYCAGFLSTPLEVAITSNGG